MPEEGSKKRTLLGTDYSGAVTRINITRCKYCGCEGLSEDMEFHALKCLSDPINKAYALNRIGSKPKSKKLLSQTTSSPELPVREAKVPGLCCGFCGKVFETEKQRNRHHPICPSNPKRVVLVKCNICRSTVKKEYLETHQKNHCRSPVKNRNINQKKGYQRSSPYRSNLSTTCYYCGATVKQRNLAEHQAKRCPRMKEKIDAEKADQLSNTSIGNVARFRKKGLNK